MNTRIEKVTDKTKTREEMRKFNKELSDKGVDRRNRSKTLSDKFGMNVSESTIRCMEK